jgi:hypothetical protein
MFYGLLVRESLMRKRMQLSRGLSREEKAAWLALMRVQIAERREQNFNPERREVRQKQRSILRLFFPSKSQKSDA